MDSKECADLHISETERFISEAKRKLQEGDLRQASEKIWGAMALAVKAHALKKHGRRLTSHRELWEYKEKIVSELGEWFRVAWQLASNMHVNFYEGWARTEDVRLALKEAEKSVTEIKRRIMRI